MERGEGHERGGHEAQKGREEPQRSTWTHTQARDAYKGEGVTHARVQVQPQLQTFSYTTHSLYIHAAANYLIHHPSTLYTHRI